MVVLNDPEIIRNEVKKVLNDPFIKILSKKSIFSKIQLETLIVDYVSTSVLGYKVPQEIKATAREISIGRSRGSYNRTLNQAKTKIRKSLYTILLLGYLGILESPDLKPFIEASNKMRDYVEAYSLSIKGNDLSPISEESQKKLLKIKEELEKSFNSL
jgi:hypothetical protein